MPLKIGMRWKRTADQLALIVVGVSLALSVFAADPTGAVEFDVESPRLASGKTVKASDFGVSPTANDNVIALNRAIEHCRSIGPCRLIVGKGVYRCTAETSISLVGMKDFVFDGAGAEFVFLHKDTRNFTIRDCERIEVGGFSVDWDWDADPLGWAARIEDVGPDFTTFRFVDYKDFPHKDIRIAFASPWDKSSREVGMPGQGLGTAYEMSWGGPIPVLRREWLSPNTVKLYKKPLPEEFRKGQYFRVTHYYYDMNGFSVGDVRHFKMQNVEIKSNPGHAIVVWGRSHHWHFKNVNIRMPIGDRRRAVTCTADHLHVASSTGFGKVENCEFSLGNDDCINIHDNTTIATERVDDHTVLATHGAPIFAGDEVELRYADLRPTGLRGPVTLRTPTSGVGTEIVFGGRVPPMEGEAYVLFNRSFSSRNMIVRNCTFRGNRGRGLAIQVPDVTVENCSFVHNESGGIYITTGWTRKLWCEGTGASNVVVHACVFDRVNRGRRLTHGMATDICIDSFVRAPYELSPEDYPIHRDILFDSNVFSNNCGLVLGMRAATNVVFRNAKVVLDRADAHTFPYRGDFRTTRQDGLVLENVGIFVGKEGRRRRPKKLGW